MTRVRRIRLLLLAVSVLGVVGFWVADAQTSVSLTSVDKVGWWTRRPAAQPTENPYNFEVASGLQGDESIAALRVLIRGDITKATLVLAEADAPLKDLTTGKLRVCTTTVPWLVADGGPFGEAPAPSCGSAVELTRTADANGTGSWSGDVTPFLAGRFSEVSLMIVPSPDPTAVLPQPWWIKLSAFINAEGTPDSVPTPAAVSPPAVPSGGVTPVAPSPAGGGGVSAPAAPADTTPTTALAPTPTSQPQRFQLATTKKEPKPWGKLFLLIPLSAMIAFVYTFSRNFLEERNALAT